MLRWTSNTLEHLLVFFLEHFGFLGAPTPSEAFILVHVRSAAVSSPKVIPRYLAAAWNGFPHLPAIFCCRYLASTVPKQSGSGHL